MSQYLTWKLSDFASKIYLKSDIFSVLRALEKMKLTI